MASAPSALPGQGDALAAAAPSTAWEEFADITDGVLSPCVLSVPRERGARARRMRMVLTAQSQVSEEQQRCRSRVLARLLQ